MYIHFFAHKMFNKSCSDLAQLAYVSKRTQSWKTNYPAWLLNTAALDIRSFDHGVS